MYNFNFYMPTKVLFGPGRLQDLHNEQLPGKKALIVTSNGSSIFGITACLKRAARNSRLPMRH